MRLLLVLAAAVTSLNSFAADETPSVASLKAGGLSISFNRSGVGYGSVSHFYLLGNPRFEYFVMDRLAIGAQTSLSTGFKTDTTVFSAGPAATYHFCNHGNISSYASVAYIFNGIERPALATTSKTLEFDVGANYNFLSWFGMGPRLTVKLNGIDKPGTTQTVDVEFINLYFYF